MRTRSIPFAAHVAVVAILAAILVVGFPRPGQACSCMEVTAAEAAAGADVVFVGREVARTLSAGNAAPVMVTFEVSEAYKGAVGAETHVFTAPDGGGCGVGPLQGPVGVAATLSEQGRVFMSLCGSVHGAAAIAAELDPIDLVEGSGSVPDSGGAGVWLWLGGGSILLAGLTLLASRRQRHYQEGWSGRV